MEDKSIKSMQIINSDIELNGTPEGVSIEIDYRCFLDSHMAFAPMTIYTTLYEGETLEQAILRGKQSYMSHAIAYKKVELIEVRTDS